MVRTFSGIQPTGEVHLGNYLGAFGRWAREQEPEHFFCIVDLHAMTAPYDPPVLRERVVDVACWLLAAGIDPDVSILFIQSHVREHTECTWILNCVATMGELSRMVQYKEKSAQRQSVSVGLFDYPVLQAADILLYDADEVPVGADQQQHVELTRDIAQRFNARFGETFALPRATLPRAGARVMDLQQPDRRMSKSVSSPQGKILLSESEEITRKKIMRAVTDSGTEIRAAEDKPGVSNLLDLLAATTGAEIAELETRYKGKNYGDLKRDVAESVNGVLRPVRQRYAELRNDPAEVAALLRRGAGAAREVASKTMDRVRERTGLVAS
ncbi:MAG: tryptophan--tRNA ligase [Nitriliruptorales bacterium]|nr:tryptophan--tRNA ligase [Nitriliruptorales bacterium]